MRPSHPHPTLSLIGRGGKRGGYLEVVDGGGALVGGLEVGVDELEVALEDGGGGVAHEVHEGDEVEAVAEGLNGEEAAEVVDLGLGDAGLG